MPRRIDLGGRAAVVTGAGSGIGRALAQNLALRGCPVAICDQDEAGLADTAASIEGPVLPRRLDVRDRQGQLAFAAEVREWATAPLGAVFNNAGVTTAQTVAEAAPEDDEWVIDVNFWGVVHGIRAFLPILLEQGSGAIVNTSSVFGLVGYPSQSAYCASKFAVRGFSESLRNELRGSGVRVVTVHPGGVDTNIVRNARWHADHLGNSDQEASAELFARFVRTSPDRAARIIIRGVERGRQRILVGSDAALLDLMVRIAPVRWYRPIAALEPLLSRRLGR
jgi:NAD(P)-dependent dehydrogenase (short-subunit alcohol dehydrogenase family)